MQQKQAYISLVPLFFILVLSMLCLDSAYALTTTEIVNSTLDEPVKRIEAWRSEARISMLLTISVIILGALSGVLPKLEFRWNKTATLIAGAAISVITALNSSVYNDSRTLTNLAQQGSLLVTRLKVDTLHLDATKSEHQQEIRANLHNFLNSFAALERLNVTTPANKSDKLTSDFSLIRAAQAGDRFQQYMQQSIPRDEEGYPYWVKSPPKDSANLYFVGIGIAAGLTDAKQESFDDARKQAANYLRKTFKMESPGKVDVDDLAVYLVEADKTEQTYFSQNRKDKLYRYYTLIKLNKILLKADLALYSTFKKVPADKYFGRLIDKAQSTYTDRRHTLYSKYFEHASETVPAEVLQEFNEARRLRKDKQFDKALVLLKRVTEQAPEFYLAWFNLALAYHKMDKVPEGVAAYEQAVKLEPRQPERDASLYNAYGRFLMENKRYEEALKHLQTALQIDPEHPSAGRALERVKRQLKESRPRPD